jgi:hypothetical protein
VVKRGEFDPGRLVGDISMHLHNVGQGGGCDCDYSRTSGTLSTHAWLIVTPALQQGKEVYRA